jgi:hypothetical protein
MRLGVLTETNMITAIQAYESYSVANYYKVSDEILSSMFMV